MSKLKEILADRYYLKICIFAALTATTLFVVYKLLANFSRTLEIVQGFFGGIIGAMAPVLIGILIAYLLNPVVNIVDKKIMTRLFIATPIDPKKAKKQERRKKNISILITFLIIFAVLFAIIYTISVMVVGQLVFASFSSMIDSVWGYFMKNVGLIDVLQEKLESIGMADKLQELIDSVFSWLSKNTDPTALVDHITSISGGIFNIALGLIVSIYLLIDREFFLRLCRKTGKIIMSPAKYEKTSVLLGEINLVIASFLRGQMLDGLIIAILSSVGLHIIGVQFAIFIGFFAGIANIIPYFGPILGMVPAVVVALLTGDFTQALLAVAVLFGIQQIDSMIISPRVVGTSTGLHPVFVLMAVTVGGYYMGIIGMLVAVPIAAIIKLLLSKRYGAVE